MIKILNIKLPNQTINGSQITPNSINGLNGKIRSVACTIKINKPPTLQLNNIASPATVEYTINNLQVVYEAAAALTLTLKPNYYSLEIMA